MYDFTNEEKEFLQRFGATGNGKLFIDLLKKITSNVDRSSNIPKDSDYGAQVEGRSLVAGLFRNVIDLMKPRKQRRSTGDDQGVDEYF